jgi:TldD protein
MRRRDFIQLAGMGAGALALPYSSFGQDVEAERLLDQLMDAKDKKTLCDVALNTAKSLGATYTDVRIGRYLNQFVTTREKKVQGITNTESFGVGIRVIANGTWGFAASNNVTPEGMKKTAERAVAIAKANSKFQTAPVVLAATPAYGEVSWKTPIKKNGFEVPVKEKVDLLMNANAKALEKGATFVNSQIFLVNEQKYLATSEGSYIDQDVYRIFPNIGVTMIDRASGQFKNRSGFGTPMGMGYEYLDGRPEDKMQSPGGIILYNKSYDIVEDAGMAADQAKQMIAAKTVEPGKYDLVLEPSHLWLTIHESVGHPTELDRVLGYEANYAGTSFLTLDKWQSKKFNFGSKAVNVVADKVQPGSLGAVGYDDEGVKCKSWDLIKDGILVNYQAIRDQVNIIGQKESHGCCYSQGWADVQFQRMANVSLQPGKERMTPQEMIAGVEKGIYIVKEGSFSIDQQRYNFQFGGVLFF